MADKQIDEKRRVEEIYMEGGAEAVEKYIEEHLDQWKNTKVSIAVTGGTATGKSTLLIKYEDCSRVKKIKKPFCFVRSKVDLDYQNLVYDNRLHESATSILSGIHQNINQSLAKYENLKADAIFVISSRDAEIGDTPKLLRHMEKRMPFIKYESIVRSLESFSDDVIERKYQLLKGSLFRKSLSLAFKTTSKLYNLKDVLQEAYTEYLNVFNITSGKEPIRTDQIILTLVEFCEETNVVERLHDMALKGMMTTLMTLNPISMFPAIIYGVGVSYQSNARKMYVSLESMLNKAHNLAKEDYKNMYKITKNVQSKI
ncbi:unnamed protein product [Mytilus edulis]|uniref:Uncharacterized protein n=1 Tax=Mytilus edulis TaxID=6550 RepID=A0A8S3T4K1_MYTED|nr:unnamed protein product [Mytilus edulis]